MDQEQREAEAVLSGLTLYGIDWSVPVGAIYHFQTDLPPDSHRWLPCDGRKCDKDVYPDLSSIFAQTYAALPSGDFYLPNLDQHFIKARP